MINSISKNILTYPWDNLDFVQNFLAQTYYYVNHSEKLLCLSMARLSEDKEFRRFKEHLIEESAHDRLAINDLKKFNSNINNHTEYATTKAFYQTQYYLIEHKHPLSLLGYILFLEELADQAGRSIHEKLEEYYSKTSAFIKLHYEEDEDHVEEAKKLINTLPEEIKSIIYQNYDDSKKLYYSMLDQIVEEITSKNQNKAA